MGTFGNIQPYFHLGAALVIGLLIGAERGWHTRDLSGGLRAAGIRTFGLVGLLGGILGMLSDPARAWLLGLGFLSVAAIATASHVMTLRQRGDGDYGITTLIALLVTFGLGALAVSGNVMLALAVGVVTTALLQVKPELHHWIGTLDRFELNGAIKLLLISLVALPVMPNKGFGPGGSLNPFELWWMVVLVSGLSFAGYIALKFAGPRLGPMVSAVLGGLASSTATTVSLSRLDAQSPGMSRTLAAGITTASAIMFFRVLVIAWVVNGSFALELALPLIVMGAVSLAGAAVLATRKPPDAETADVKFEIADPSELGTALKFGVFLVFLVIAVHYLRMWLDDRGLYAVAAAAGLADVDAITLTTARLVDGGLGLPPAALSVLLAVMVNTLVKIGIARVVSGAALALPVAAALAPALVLGGVAWAVF